MSVLSVVVPCYNEGDVLARFFDECCRVFDSLRDRYALSFELVLVDDGSKDATLSIMKSIEETATACTVKWVSFSRNFGKEAALLAGLERASGDYVAIMDADMQDPPSLLSQMFERMFETDCDCVATRRANRKGEPPIRSLLSRGFYRLINAISETEFVSGERDFRLMKRVVVDSVLSLEESNRFSKGIFGWVGFKTEWISYDNVERQAGQTKWSTRGLFRYALDGITAFSAVPLQLSSAMSLLLFIVAFVAMVFIIVRWLIFGDPVAGWASTACIILFVGSLQLFCLGVMGNYLAKTYLETKNRPMFIVREESDGQ